MKVILPVFPRFYDSYHEAENNRTELEQPGRTEIMARILPIGFMSLHVQVLIDGEVVEEAEGQMIGFFVS